MPKKSKAQGRLMGAAYNCKKTGYCPSEKIKSVADSMSLKSLKDFAKGSTKGLPEKVSESFISFKEFVERKQQTLNESSHCQCGCKSCKDGDCKKCSCKDCECEGCSC